VRTPSLTRGGLDAGGTAPVERGSVRKAAAARADREERLSARSARTTLSPDRLAIVADAGTRCGRPAAVPACCTGVPGRDEEAITTATTVSATATATAVAAATSLFVRPRALTARSQPGLG